MTSSLIICESNFKCNTFILINQISQWNAWAESWHYAVVKVPKEKVQQMAKSVTIVCA